MTSPKKNFFFLTIVISISYCDADIVSFGVDLIPYQFQNTISLLKSSINELASDFNKHVADKTYDSEFQTQFLASYHKGLKNPEIFFDFMQLVEVARYEAEEHTVITEDGYILTVFRIPGEGPPVYLQHGLLCSADDWVTGGINSALPYFLVEDGYDVWFGNFRGSKYSKNHTSLSPDSPEFWDFSWHEMGLYDLPAMIDYILEQTCRKKLRYIGHSQGATAYFVMQSERPEYNDKVHIGIMFSAVAWMGHVKSPLVRLFIPFADIVRVFFEVNGINELFPDNVLAEVVKDTFCDTNVLFNLVCTNIYFLFIGFDFEQINPERMPVQIGHLPTSSSIKQIIHYTQLEISRYFRQYDYGRAKNKKKYGTVTPPDYHVENITSPLAIFYSDNDWLASTTDIQKLLDKVPNVVDYYKIPCDNFNHLDYLWAKDLQTLEYPRVKQLLQKYGD